LESWRCDSKQKCFARKNFRCNLANETKSQNELNFRQSRQAMQKRKTETFIDYFTKSGFDMVFNRPIIFNNKYIFSHEPVFIPQGSNFINIHGHTHNRFVTENFFLSEYNKSFPKKKVNPKNYINVCMDANNFEILKLNELIDF
jgi:hypothetical protein